MPHSVLIALGSNLGDRGHHLRMAIEQLRGVIGVVRVSRFIDTEPVDAPPGSPRFLNAVIAGYTSLGPHALLVEIQAIERKLGRRRGVRNAPRTIDLDLIFYSALRVRSKALTLPHPRACAREFVMKPFRELGLNWVSGC
jgi:2-amino-4-hydroxy-6-hydroxymethyldihydropteridine diphosphokinase